jgi:4-carboxymuconolactone decarboxylase
LRAWVPIWVVRVGDALYVRSYRGNDGAWYRHATQRREGRIRAGGVERDVAFDTVDAVDDTVQSVIDQAYRAKYARYGDTHLRPMPGPAGPRRDPAARTSQLRRQHQQRKDEPMTQSSEPSSAQHPLAGFAPDLVAYTSNVLFGQVWERPQLPAKERSLITVACLTTGGNTDQLTFHLDLARQSGATEDELIEVITHLAFYAGWPKAMSAMTVAKQVLCGN